MGSQEPEKYETSQAAHVGTDASDYTGYDGEQNGAAEPVEFSAAGVGPSNLLQLEDTQYGDENISNAVEPPLNMREEAEREVIAETGDPISASHFSDSSDEEEDTSQVQQRQNDYDQELWSDHGDERPPPTKPSIVLEPSELHKALDYDGEPGLTEAKEAEEYTVRDQKRLDNRWGEPTQSDPDVRPIHAFGGIQSNDYDHFGSITRNVRGLYVHIPIRNAKPDHKDRVKYGWDGHGKSRLKTVLETSDDATHTAASETLPEENDLDPTGETFAYSSSDYSDDEPMPVVAQTDAETDHGDYVGPALENDLDTLDQGMHEQSNASAADGNGDTDRGELQDPEQSANPQSSLAQRLEAAVSDVSDLDAQPTTPGPLEAPTRTSSPIGGYYDDDSPLNDYYSDEADFDALTGFNINDPPREQESLYELPSQTVELHDADAGEQSSETPPTPPSAKLLKQMTGTSTEYGEMKFKRLLELANSRAMQNPQRALEMKRQMLLYIYGRENDRVSRIGQNAALVNETARAAWKSATAHHYRFQREQAREQLKQANLLKDQWQTYGINMKGELDQEFGEHRETYRQKVELEQADEARQEDLRHLLAKHEEANNKLADAEKKVERTKKLAMRCEKLWEKEKQRLANPPKEYGASLVLGQLRLPANPAHSAGVQTDHIESTKHIEKSSGTGNTKKHADAETEPVAASETEPILPRADAGTQTSDSDNTDNTSQTGIEPLQPLRFEIDSDVRPRLVRELRSWINGDEFMPGYSGIGMNFVTEEQIEDILVRGATFSELVSAMQERGLLSRPDNLALHIRDLILQENLGRVPPALLQYLIQVTPANSEQHLHMLYDELSARLETIRRQEQAITSFYECEATYEARMDQLKQTLKNTQYNLQEREQRLNAANEALDIVSAQVTALENDQNELAATKIGLNEANGRILYLEALETRLEQTKTQLERDLEETRATLQQLTEQLTQSPSNESQGSTDGDQKKSDAQHKDLEACQAHGEQLQACLDDADCANGKLQSNLDECRRHGEELHADNDKLREAAAEWQRRFEEKDAQWLGQIDRLKELESGLDGPDHDVLSGNEVKQDETAGKQDEVTRLKDEIECLQADKKTLADEKDRLSTDNSRLASANSELSTSSGPLKGDATVESTSTSWFGGGLRSQNKQLRTDNERLEQLRNRLEAEVQMLESLRPANEELTTDNHQLSEQNQRLDQEMQNLQAEHDNLKSNFDRAVDTLRLAQRLEQERQAVVQTIPTGPRTPQMPAANTLAPATPSAIPLPNTPATARPQTATNPTGLLLPSALTPRPQVSAQPIGWDGMPQRWQRREERLQDSPAFQRRREAILKQLERESSRRVEVYESEQELQDRIRSMATATLVAG